MSISPADRISLTLDNVRKIVGDSPNFQAVIKTAGIVAYDNGTYTGYVSAGRSDPSTNRTAALAKVYIWRCDDTDVTQVMPRCIVRPWSQSMTRKAVATRYGGGTIGVLFEFPIPASLSASDECVDFTNKLGGILKDVEDLSDGVLQSGGYIQVPRIDIDGMGKADQDDNPDDSAAGFVPHWVAECQFHWEGK